MSNNIETNVVKMEFENGSFERNVETSISTLDKLKRALGMGDASKEFDQSTSLMSRGLDTVKQQFSALEFAAKVALANIVNRAVNTGIQMTRALTIEPIMDGYREYELKMGSVQTMMMSSGESLETVNGYLQQLNTYADKTIYSFSDMTSNIGKFTNAGVKLDSAVKAIQGISNEAALSGANANEASRAMYNFAQALSAGAVKLIDWKSIENANMATVEFKQELIDTAVELGTLSKEGDEYKSTTVDLTGKVSDAFNATKNFNDSLAHQWMTTDVLVNTLAKYSDETTEIGKRAFEAATKVKTFTQLMDTLKEAVGSGWATSFEIMIGDFEEARELYTEISDTIGGIIDSSADKRNYMLTQTFASGWKQILNEGIMDAKGYRETVTQVAKDHGIAVDEIINKNGGFEKSLKEGWLNADILKESLQKLTDKYVKMSDEERRNSGYTKENIDQLKQLNNEFQNGTKNVDFFVDAIKKSSGRENLVQSLRNIFNGVMSVVTPVKEAISEVVTPLTGDKLYKLTEAVANFTAKLTLTDSESKNLKNTFKGLGSIFEVLCQTAKVAFTVFSPLLKVIRPLVDLALLATGTIGKLTSSLVEMLKNTGLIDKFISSYTGFIDNIVDLANSAVVSFGEFKTSTVNFFRDMASGLDSAVNSIKDANSKLWANIGISDKLQNQLKIVGNAFSKFLGALKSGFSDVFQNFDFASFLAKLIAVIGGLSIDKALANLSKFTEGFKSFADGLPAIAENISEGISKITDAFAKQTKKSTSVFRLRDLVTITAWATAIGILSMALYELGKLRFDQIANGIVGLTAAMISMALGLKMMSKAIGTMSWKEMDNMKYLMGIFMSFAQSVVALSTAVKLLADLSWDELGRGLAGTTALMVTMSASAKVMSSGGNRLVKGATNLIVYAMAIKTLATVVKTLSGLGWEELGRGLSGLMGVMTEVIVSLKLLGNNSGHILKGSIALQSLSVGLLLLIPVIKTMASLSWESLGKVGAGLAGTLVILSTAMKSISNTQSFGGAASLIVLAAALNVMIPPLLVFSKLSMKQIGSTVVLLGGVLTELSIALKMISGNSALRGASSLVLVSTAIGMLTPSLLLFSQLGLDEIGKSLLILGGALAELSVAMRLMQGSLKGALALTMISAAIDVLAVGLLAINTLSLGDSIKTLATLAGTLAIIGTAAQVMSKMLPAMVKMTLSMTLFGAACIALGTGITFLSEGLSKFAKSMIQNLNLLLQTALSAMPLIFEVIKTGIIGICDIIKSCAGSIVEAVVEVCHQLLVGIQKIIPDITKVVIDIVDQVLKQLADYAPSIVESVMVILLAVVNGIAKYADPIVQALADVFSAITDAIFGRLRDYDSETLVKMGGVLLGLTGFMTAMALLKSLIPSAMVGVLEFGLFVAELSAVLAALGAISLIPGLNWLVEQGGNFLEAIGTAVGKLIGGLVGGIAQGVTSSLPSIARDLSAFMEELVPFLTLASGYQSGSFDVINELVGCLMGLTGQKILDGLTSWFTGGTDFAKFGEDIAVLGPSLKQFADSVKGLDAEAVQNATNCAKMIAGFTGSLPKEGGVVGWWSGNRDLTKFVENLEPLGKALKSFGSSVNFLNAGSVEKATNAGKLISGFMETLPKSGGVTGWWSGNSNVTKFIEDLVPLGEALVEFSNSAIDLKPSAVEGAANAGHMLANLVDSMPKSGGLSDVFNGSADVKRFAEEIVPLGYSLKEFSDAVIDLKASCVENAANAASVLSKFAENLPKQGGLKTIWDGGRESITQFAKEIIPLGQAIKEFSDTVIDVKSSCIETAANAAGVISQFTGNLPKQGGLKTIWDGHVSLTEVAKQIVPLGEAIKTFSDTVVDIKYSCVESAANAAKLLAEFMTELPDTGGLKGKIFGDIELDKFAEGIADLGPAISKFSSSVGELNEDAVAKAVNAAKLIAELAQIIPSFGGISVTWEGDDSLIRFAEEMTPLGPALAKFSESVKDLDPEAVSRAGTAAKTIAEFAEQLPAYGGIMASFTGEQDMSILAEQLVPFGKAINEFAATVKDLDTNVVQNAGNAAKAISAFAAEVPRYGGVNQWWSGDNTLTRFAQELENLGPSLKSFANSINGMNPDVVTNSANSAKALAEFAQAVPRSGEFMEWWDGKKSLAAFGKGVAEFGPYLKTFADSVAGMDVDVATNAASCVNALTEFADFVPKSGGLVEFFAGSNNIKGFGDGLVSFGQSITAYYNEVSTVDFNQLSQAIDNLISIADAANVISGIDNSSINNLAVSLNNLGNCGFEGFISAFGNEAFKKAISAVEELIKRMADTFKTQGSSDMKSSGEAVGKAAISKLKTFKSEFRDLGKELASFLASGLSNTTKIRDIKKSLDSVLGAAKDHIRSYYNLFYSAGSYLVDGLANGISENDYKAAAKASAMASSALKSAKLQLQEKSPSKATYEMGMFFVQGLVNGIADNTKFAESEAGAVGNSVISKLGTAMRSLDSVIQNELNTSPTITPVLDLSNVENNVGRLDSIFGTGTVINAGLQVQSTTERANRLSGHPSTNTGVTLIADAISKISAQPVSSGESVVNMTFNISGANSSPKEIANEVSTEVAKLFQRRRSAW